MSTLMRAGLSFSLFLSVCLSWSGCGPSPSNTDGPPPPTPALTVSAPTQALTANSTSSATATAVATAEPTPPPEPIRARFLSVGDVIFGRRVQKTIDAKADPEHPFRPLAKLYSEVDFTFANLENPFFSGKKPNVTPPGKRYAVLWAKPEHVTSLVKYKFTAVNLANNHAMDQDLTGLTETIRTLDNAGVAHTGTGQTLDEAWTPMIVDVRGLKIAFVGASYASKNDMGARRNPYVARVEDEDRLAAACKRAKEKAHFLVVTYHAGDEHKFVPNGQQKAFVKAAVKAGADLVIGGHPHVVQPAEQVDGTWVFYSIGNYIFDQVPDINNEAIAVDLSLILQPGADRAQIEKLLIHPVVIKDSAPGPANEERSARIMGYLKLKKWQLVP